MVMNNKTVALDTHIFIYYYEQNPQYFIKAEEILKKLQDNKSKAITSIVTLIELLSFPSLGEQKVKELQEHFLLTPNLAVFDVNQIIALDAARIRREYHFRISDSIQLATAKQAKVDLFITNDQ